MATNKKDGYQHLMGTPMDVVDHPDRTMGMPDVRGSAIADDNISGWEKAMQDADAPGKWRK